MNLHIAPDMARTYDVAMLATGRLLRKLVDQWNVQIDDLVPALGLERAQISRHINGKRMPTYKAQQAYAAFFRMSFEEFEARWRAIEAEDSPFDRLVAQLVEEGSTTDDRVHEAGLLCLAALEKNRVAVVGQAIAVRQGVRTFEKAVSAVKKILKDDAKPTLPN